MARFVLFIFVLMIAGKAIVSASHGRIASLGRQYETEAMTAEMVTAEKVFFSAAGASVQANGSDATIPTPQGVAAAPVCGGNNCNFDGSASFTITGQPTSSLSSGHASSTGDDVSNNLQRNALIAENTGSVEITANVWPSLGGPTVSGCELVTFRTRKQQPYIEPTARASCSANVGVSLERDAGGCNPSSVSTCDPTGGTQVTPTSTVTQAVAQCTQWCAAATPPPSQNDYVNNTWQSGDQVQGWSTR